MIAIFLVIGYISWCYLGVGVAVVLPAKRFVLWAERSVSKRGTAGTRINFCKGNSWYIQYTAHPPGKTVELLVTCWWILFMCIDVYTHP